MDRGAAFHELTAREADDLDASIATFTEEERNALAAAEEAIDSAMLLHPLRALRDLAAIDPLL